jgi:hypothetical protein
MPAHPELLLTSVCHNFGSRLTLGGTLLGYYIVAAVYVVKYTDKHLMWPDYAWCMAMGAAILWLFTSCCACGNPRCQQYRLSCAKN